MSDLYSRFRVSVELKEYSYYCQVWLEDISDKVLTVNVT